MKGMQQEDITAALFLAADKMCEDINGTQDMFDYAASRKEDGTVAISVTDFEDGKRRRHIDVEFRRRNSENQYNVIQSRWHVVTSNDPFSQFMKVGYMKMLTGSLFKSLSELDPENGKELIDEVFADECKCEIAE